MWQSSVIFKSKEAPSQKCTNQRYWVLIIISGMAERDRRWGGKYQKKMEATVSLGQSWRGAFSRKSTEEHSKKQGRLYKHTAASRIILATPRQQAWHFLGPSCKEPAAHVKRQSHTVPTNWVWPEEVTENRVFTSPRERKIHWIESCCGLWATGRFHSWEKSVGPIECAL